MKINKGLRRQLAELIITRCSLDSRRQKIPTAIARKYIPDQLTEWGRARLADDGDVIRGYLLMNENWPMQRACCFVRVSNFIFMCEHYLLSYLVEVRVTCGSKCLKQPTRRSYRGNVLCSTPANRQTRPPSISRVVSPQI